MRNLYLLTSGISSDDPENEDLVRLHNVLKSKGLSDEDIAKFDLFGFENLWTLPSIEETDLFPLSQNYATDVDLSFLSMEKKWKILSLAFLSKKILNVSWLDTSDKYAFLLTNTVAHWGVNDSHHKVLQQLLEEVMLDVEESKRKITRRMRNHTDAPTFSRHR